MMVTRTHLTITATDGYKLFELMVVREVPSGHKIGVVDRERILTEIIREYAKEIAHSIAVHGEYSPVFASGRNFGLTFDCYRVFDTEQES